MREVRLVTILTCGVLVPPPMVFSLRVAGGRHGWHRVGKSRPAVTASLSTSGSGDPAQSETARPPARPGPTAVTARRAHGAFRFSKRAAAPQRDHVTGELDKVAPHPARHSPERPNEPNQGVRMTPLPAGRCAPDG
jgi:hypothetical protein